MGEPIGGGTGGIVRDLLIEDELRESYLKYAMSVIVARALPDARDGLKPSQRRILVAMNDLNLGPRAKHRKCAKISGDTSGNYHPHGESVVYPTLVRMAQDFNMRYLLVDPQGNFGSIDGDPPAAMRYTEARMTSFSALMMEDIDEDTVDVQPNYDEQRTEPVVLPAKFPNLLVNGSTGIAVGMATNIPTHNLTEIIDGLIHLIENPDCKIDDLLEHVHGPDFPTGGLICASRRQIRSIYRTGRGRLDVRSRVHVESDKRGEKKTVIITEIPYQVSKKRLIETIADNIKRGRIPGISTVVDHSDREGMRVAVVLKRGEDEKVILNQLFRYTPMQNTYSVNMISLIGGRPRTLNLKEMMEAFRDHRVEVIRRRTRYRLRKAEARLHILEGLIIALASIGEVIKIIRESADTPAAREGLMGGFQLSRTQADAILDMRLSRLTALEVEKLHAERGEVLDRIREYRSILADVNLVLDIIKEDLYELKEKYGDGRRTQIVGAVDEVSTEDLIREEDMAVTISHAGYVKRQPLSSYRAQRRGGKGVRGMAMKEEDWTESLFIASTHDYLLFLTDKGRLHWLKVYDIPQFGRAAKGRAIVNVLQLDKDEKVTSMVPVRTFDPDRFLFLATRKGTVKKTSLDQFSNVRKIGIYAIKLAENDHLIGAELTDGSSELVLATRNGQAVRFDETDVRAMGRTAAGVRGANLVGDDEVVALVKPTPGSKVLTVCRNGYGKQTDVEEYRKVRRGAKGVININTSDRNGPVVACMAVREGDQIMVMTSGGQVVRIRVDEIRSTGRNAQGVRVVKFKGGEDFVASVARIARENGDEDDNGGEDAAVEAVADEAVADEAEPLADSTSEEDVDAGGPDSGGPDAGEPGSGDDGSPDESNG